MLLMLGAFTGSLAYLERRAERTDSLPILHYEQPVWSEDESRLAYFRLLMPPGGGAYTCRQLWWADRIGSERRLVAEFPPGELRIAAWIENDSSILLQPPQQPGQPPVLIQVATDGSFRRTVRFEQVDLQLIGVRGGEVFFQRSLKGAVTLLSWSPGERIFRPVARFPSTSAEQLNLEEVSPSPDGNKLAVVVASGSTRGVWIYDRASRTLRYSFISTEGRSLRTTWSSDSRGLAAAAELGTRCELYMLTDVEEGQFTRLSTPSSSACLPFWPRDSDRLLLLQNNTVLAFHPFSLVAERILDRVRAGRLVQDLAVSSRGNWAAYHSRQGVDDDIYVVSLKTSQSRTLLPPGTRRELQQTLLYQIGSGTQYAVNHWTGGGEQ
ncbi:MAG: hypothetical protein AMXMBFR33_02860 [Candidatus Xenobia bacterium]